MTIPINPGQPIILGTPQAGQVLTATVGCWLNGPTSYTYAWLRAGAAISGANGPSYIPVAADVGSTLTVSVVAANSSGSSAPATSAATTAVAAAGSVPVNMVLPTISGTAQVGQTLTATNGTWTNSPTSFTYQWNRAGTPIGGATASTYVPVTADVGNTLTVTVTATNSSGPSAPATSSATSSVIDIIPTINTAASIPGTPHVGSPITAIDAVWNHSVTSVAYQWQAAGVHGTGAGATTLTYTPAAGDLGKTLTITVTATNSGGTSAPSTSAASAAVIAAGAVPVLFPTATLFNATLSSTNNGWTGFQQRQVIGAANLPNPGFTAGLIQVTFDLAAGSSGGTLTGADIGNLGTSNAISFDGSQVPLTFGGSSTITGLGPGTFLSDAVPFTINMTAGLVISSLWGAGTTNALEAQGTSPGNLSANSPSVTDQTATTPANYPASWNVHAKQATFISNVTFSAAPFITGTAQVGQPLTASHGAWTNIPTSFTYQWNRAGTPIGGATASAYVPVAADVGNTLTVTVFAANSGGSSAPATSAATSAVAAAGGVPVNTGVPTISGTAQVGQTLTATNGTWTNSPTSFTYQWYRAGTPIGGAAASIYVPVSADVGNTLTVWITATNGSGSSTPATSAATSAVIDMIPANSSLPSISGTAQVAQTLTATTGTWTHNPTSFTYQWNRAGTPIGGATASTYVPVTADVGNTLTVSVVAMNSGGSSAPATSSATSSVIDIIPTVNTAASIPGTPHVGSPITAKDAVWNHSVTSVAYQWQAAGVNGTGAGATTLTYTPAAGDRGKTLTITVTATNSGGTSAPSISAASAAVIAAGAVPVLLPIATLFNAALSSTNNGWTGWQSRQVIAASNLANPGFTSGLIQVTFDLAAGSSGGTLAGAYVGNLGTSNAISFDGSQVPLTFGGSPTITGLGPGTFLSDAVPFTINMTAGLVISSLWGAGTTNALEAPGTSTGNTVANSNSIVDQTATTPANYPASWNVHNNQCTLVSNVTFSAAPYITGIAKVGQTLTASHGAWTNSPTSFAYQWKRAGTSISGATGSTYIPVAADVGNTLTVSVVAMNSGGPSLPATSAATAPVAAPASAIPLDFFGVAILAPIETNIGGSGKPLVWPTWNPTSWRAIDNYGGVPPGFTYTQSISGWGSVETSKGVYDWSLFDLVWPKLISQGVTDIIFSLQSTPLWANGGVVAAPPTNMSDLTNWVTSYLTRATLDGLPIKYVEGVNEPNNGGSFYNGTIAQLVTMQQTLYNAAKAYDPSIQVLTPPVNAVGSFGRNYLQSFLVAGGGAYADIMTFHGYAEDAPTNSQVLYNNDIAAFVSMLAANGQSGKPLWNTEYSSLSGVISNDVTYLAATTFIDLSHGVSRKYYYAYDGGSPNDVLWGPPSTGVPGVLNAAGIAYREIVGWLTGATLSSPLALSGVIWSINLILSSGAQAQAVWTSDGSTPSYPVPSWATQYKTLAGGTVTGLGATVVIGGNPLLFM